MVIGSDSSSALGDVLLQDHVTTRRYPLGKLGSVSSAGAKKLGTQMTLELVGFV